MRSIEARHRQLSAVALTGVGSAVGLLVTAVILGTPYLVFGYHSPSLHLVLDSVDACVALLVAYLVHGRFVRYRRAQDLLLAQGLVLLAVAGLGLALLVELLDDVHPENLDVWLSLSMRVLGGFLIAAAAMTGIRGTTARVRRWLGLAPALVMVAVSVLLWLQRANLPAALDPVPPASAQHPVLTGHPLMIAAQAFTGVCFLVAAVAFTRHAVRREDQLLRWLGPACALAAFARVNYVLFPSLYTDWLYTGDLLRTGCYVLLLVGGTREIKEYWSAQPRAAVLEDRRRLARELHDGVIQELGYIRAECSLMSAQDGRADRVVASCDRALDEARAAVDALGRPSDEPLSFVLHRAARQVADRYDGQLDVELDDSVTADHEQSHALVRITREAVSNAIRHGGAQRVRVQVLRDQTGRCLVIEDDGRGFDIEVAAVNSTGYGLTSMRDRAQGLPGSLRIRSAPEQGTAVAVRW